MTVRSDVQHDEPRLDRDGATAKASDLAQLYLELLKRTLRNEIYAEAELRRVAPSSMLRRAVLGLLRPLDLTVVRATPFREIQRQVRWPGSPHYAHTMVSRERLDNVLWCIEQVLRDGVPGDLMETGVWRGGVIVLMRAVLKVHGVTNRMVWAADSFQGLPPPDLKHYPADGDVPWHLYPDARVSVQRVQENLRRYDLLDDQVRILPGWFKDTLPTAPIKSLAVLRLDGDMYESTMESLVNLYSKLSVGGFLIVDDYELPACRKAIHDFREERKISGPLVPIDSVAVDWRKMPTERD